MSDAPEERLAARLAHDWWGPKDNEFWLMMASIIVADPEAHFKCLADCGIINE